MNLHLLQPFGRKQKNTCQVEHLLSFFIKKIELEDDPYEDYSESSSAEDEQSCASNYWKNEAEIVRQDIHQLENDIAQLSRYDQLNFF